jgi:LysR family glycine cleavage system transcriptional activator
LRSSPFLPPLSAARVFQVVANRGSFRLAGEELLITQSAVSHHIKQLESALGTPLFRRKSKSIELTEAGTMFLATVDEAFTVLSEGTARVRSRSGQTSLRVSLLPSFAANWLVNRLGSFLKSYPAIELELDPTLRIVDVGRGEADVAIRFGDFGGSKQSCVHLANEDLSPVLSPALYGDGSQFQSALDLLNQEILQAKSGLEWQLWSEAAGFPLERAKQTRLTDYNIVLQAALDGQGVAMGRGLLVREHIRAGRLVRPLSASLSSQKAAYWAAFDPLSKKLEAIEAFVAWLKSEMTLSAQRTSGPIF